MRTPLTLCALLLCATAQAQTHSAANPVVVELFTSEGCSSCPPADALLAALATQPGNIALSEHVTYWDQFGWTDPYASPSFTDRQEAYKFPLGLSNAFTPQMVIQGQKSVTGSDYRNVLEAVENAPAVAPVTITLGTGLITLPDEVPEGATVWLMYLQRTGQTQVTRGENADRTLNHSNIVRRVVAYPDPSSTVLPIQPFAEDGLAVLVQKGEGGPLLAAGLAWR
ncbi:MAG: DUF1223 domain-containing protein [Proteobacteria bacterium]|nr:DUF1223 domain-containing protein [Pseudomonadota bacterium]